MIRLVEELARGMSPAAQSGAESAFHTDTTSSDALEVFNPQEALTRCLQSRNMVREMIQFFFDEVDEVLAQLRSALHTNDLLKVGYLGHRLKGTVVYLGAHAATEAALGVERFCKSSGGTLTEAEVAVNALQRACDTLTTTLVAHPLWIEGSTGNGAADQPAEPCHGKDDLR